MVFPSRSSSDVAIPGSPLTEQDAAALIRLLGQVIPLSGGITRKRQALLDGLGNIIGAGEWVWCVAERSSAGAIDFKPAQHGGFSNEACSRFIGRMNHRAPALNNGTGGNELWEVAEYLGSEDALMTSVRVMERGRISVICFLRDTGGQPFDTRESRICEILLREIPWLHSEDFTETIEDDADIVPLFPRHRVVLALLCEGWGRSKIAGHLGLSIHTVNGYAKAIFKHFGVHSQCELIARFSPAEAPGQGIEQKGRLMP